MAEEWQSGRMRSLGKRVYRKVSQVRILSPPPWAGESDQKGIVGSNLVTSVLQGFKGTAVAKK